MSIPTRTCTTCNANLPATEEFFNRQKGNKTGKRRLRAVCRRCRAEQERERRYAKTGQRPERLPDGKRRCSVCKRVMPSTEEFFITERGKVRNPCLECSRERNRRAYHRNGEERIAQVARWRKANHAKTLIYSRRWREANLELSRKQSREYARANKEKRREYNARWRSTPRGNALHRAKEARRRARKRSAPGDHTASDVLTRYDLQAGKCYWCGKRVAFGEHDVDHIFPLSKGGGNGPGNICVSCPACNRSKSAKSPLEFTGRLF